MRVLSTRVAQSHDKIHILHRWDSSTGLPITEQPFRLLLLLRWLFAFLFGSFFRGLLPWFCGGGSFLRSLGSRSAFRGSCAFFPFFLLLFDHLHIGSAGGSSFGSLGSLFFFGAWRSNRDHGNLFVPDNLDSRRRFDFTQMNRLADIQMRHINNNLLR